MWTRGAWRRVSADDMYDQPISELGRHGKLEHAAPRRFVFFQWKTKIDVGLDARRRLNHKYDPRHPLRNIQYWKRCLHRRKMATLTWSQAWRDSSKKCELFVSVQNICSKIFRDHLVIQASSVGFCKYHTSNDAFLRCKTCEK